MSTNYDWVWVLTNASGRVVGVFKTRAKAKVFAEKLGPPGVEFEWRGHHNGNQSAWRTDYEWFLPDYAVKKWAAV